jgi:hypothetical protein
MHVLLRPKNRFYQYQAMLKDRQKPTVFGVDELGER